jgi:hypothetical protein
VSGYIYVVIKVCRTDRNIGSEGYNLNRYALLFSVFAGLQHVFTPEIWDDMKKILFAFSLACLAFSSKGCVHAEPVAPLDQAANSYIAVRPNFALPPIVVRSGAAPVDWSRANAPETPHSDPGFIASSDTGYIAPLYLRDAVERMTGKRLSITGGNDFSAGIVLLTLAQAPDSLKQDPAVVKALRDDGKDSYNANEAYYIRSEANRVVVIANTADGLLDGVVALLESVGYEVLGMGPNWINIPDYHTKPLTFSIREEGRPGFYIRNLYAASGQPTGIGTLHQIKLSDADDETVESSYQRWRIGTRMMTRSMPDFPGHALQAYHRSVVQMMWKTQTTDGFLVPITSLGRNAQRPAADAENKGELWINDDPAGDPQAGKVYWSHDNTWQEADLSSLPANLDLTVEAVRRVVLAKMEQEATASFARAPDELFVFGTDPEDGAGAADFAALRKNPDWYPEYLAQEGVKFGQPYALNGFKGLNQPRELWDANAPTDTVFGFNNWLLREFDKWIDSLPEKERLTATGKSKKDLVRVSLYSYNYHDVPPNFNLDPRIRLMVAGYPKFRGTGKWQKLATQADIAQAFKILLPREPSGDYWILSLANYYDYTTSGISGSESANAIQQRIQQSYESGFKALSAETDFNFGKKGLDYYLYAKMLWNPQLTAAQLNDLRTRWLQRAFGPGWQEMKEYYDFMTPEKFTINSPNNWAKAVRLIQAADAKMVDGSLEQKRLNDVKQFWYFYYILDSGQAKPPFGALRELVWKGQMSYMTAMFMVTQRYFGSTSAFDVAGAPYNTGPAHYTHEETQAWWTKVLEHWQVTPVDEFSDAVLADGTKASAVDQNDLVWVKEFQSEKDNPQNVDNPFFYNSYEQKAASFLTIAKVPGAEIGFKMYWPWHKGDRLYGTFDVPYGISHWNVKTQAWDDLVDMATTSQKSELTAEPNALQVVTVRYKAPSAGTYRIDVGPGGMLAHLTSLEYNVLTREYSAPHPQTYFKNQDGLTQPSTFVYIPKGTRSFDLEVWAAGNQVVLFHRSLPAAGFAATRQVNISGQGTHTIALEPGEDGNIVECAGDNFGFPFLYSVPQLWAKSPSALLVPRAVAKADGLTILK